MCFFRRGVKGVDAALSNSLFEIGALKRQLPIQEMGLCNGLGLRVQSDPLSFGFVSVQAWETENPSNILFQAKADPSDTDSWHVHKYQSGQWELLIGPTLQLTKWINRTSPLQDTDLVSLQAAVHRFQETGKLEFSAQE